MSTGFKFEVDEDDTFGVASKVQSPWEFSGYSHTVAEEHLERKTTSIDAKIARANQKKELQLKRKAERERELQPKRKAEQKKKNNVDSSDDKDDEGDVDDEDDEDYSDDRENSEGSIVADSDDDGGVSEEANEEDAEDSDAEDSESEDEDEKVKVTQGKKKEFKEIQKKPKASAKFFSSVEGANFNAKSFLELHISRPLLRACEALGYKKPTPIQGACIPLALTGRDICGSAVTGSGKTAAFALPILERLLYRPRRIPAIRVLILTPTRELAVQVHSMIEKLAQFTDIRCCLVVGGLSCKVQEVALRSDPDIVIATPGRMIDHLHNTQSVGLEDLSILVLDEADRLLELGFSNEVHELVRLCPRKRQTMLFSATMTEEVNELVKLSLVNPVRLSADPSTQRPTTLIEQYIRPQHEGDKEAVLLALCTRSFTSQVIIFSGTKIEAHRLKILFGLSGLRAAELHGNLTQAQRLDALELFTNKDVDFLIATDVAALGLDIVGVETVINFECPKDITTYVHRVGRTARAGQRGCAVTFACEKDRALIKAVAKRAGSKLSNRVVPVDIIMKWHNKICEMESSVRDVIKEEREERALRKAEMEANKAQNLIDYESEIFSRPKKTWFQTPKEKRQIVKASKAAKVNGSGKSNNEDIEKAKDSKKRSLQPEKNLTRKKRRRLEAARESVDVDDDDDDGDGDEDGFEKPKGVKGSKKGMSSGKKGGGTSVADLAYRRAKAVKAMDKAREAGKLRRTAGGFNAKKKIPREKNKRAEMEELFKGDMNKSKTKGGKPGRKPGISKRSFKSKTRYKRR